MDSTQKTILYLLCGLVGITVIAVLGANLELFGKGEIVAEFAKWGLTAVLAEIVGLFVLIVRSNVFASATAPYTLVISGADELEGFDITRISWDENQCFVRFGERSVNIRPALSAFGPAFEIRLSPEIAAKFPTDEPIELSLVDVNGLAWEVRPFFLHQRQLKLAPLASPNDIVATYGKADE